VEEPEVAVDASDNKEGDDKEQKGESSTVGGKKPRNRKK
jgi:hypothetical protein